MAFSVPLVRNPARNNRLLGEYPLGNAPEVTRALNSHILESYEGYTNDEIPIMRSTSAGDFRLWFQKDADSSGDRRDGTATIGTENALFADKACKIDVQTGEINGGNGSPGDGGSLFLSLYNNDGPSAFNNYRYLEALKTGYQLKTYNRMRIWVRMPSSTVQAVTTAAEGAGSSFYFPNVGFPDGATNFHVGTYLRNPQTSTQEQESNNWKFYHYFNLPYVNNYQAIEIDYHPNAQRNDPGPDLGVMEYPLKSISGYTGDTEERNYFDLITYFYLSEVNGVNNYPATWFVDGIELYTIDFADEDIVNIYSASGVRNQVAGRENEIHVQWHRHEDLEKTGATYDVKYAFTSFYDAGAFATHGEDAPVQLNGLAGQGVFGFNTGGHNTVHYITDQIDLTGRDVVYIAVKFHAETTKFREIRVPLTQAGLPLIGQ